MSDMGDKCEHCGTKLEGVNSGWLPDGTPEGHRYHLFGKCIETLVGQLASAKARLGEVGGVVVAMRRHMLDLRTPEGLSLSLMRASLLAQCDDAIRVARDATSHEALDEWAVKAVLDLRTELASAKARCGRLATVLRDTCAGCENCYEAARAALADETGGKETKQ